MFLAPAGNYESVTYRFSKDIVSMTIQGMPGDPVISAYAAAAEWDDLWLTRKELETAVEKGKKTQKKADEELKKFLASPRAVFPNYERVVPDDNSEKVILDREETFLCLEKLDRSLHRVRFPDGKVFTVDALDPENIFLTSPGSDSYKDFIDTKLPLKKAEVSRPIRISFIVDAFEKCCLEGASRIEILVKNSRSIAIVKGVDFYKGHSASVKKVFIPARMPNNFSAFGELNV